MTKDLVDAIMTTRYEVGDGKYLSVNVTVGAVRQNRDAFMLANMALQEAERKNLQFYLIDEHDSWLPETYKRDLALTQVLLEGLKEKRIVAHFQPIFSAKTKKVVKYECLARLMGKDGEIELMPNVFIPLAHRANVYAQITKMMIRQAVKIVEAYRVNVSLNLSISDIHNRRTCDYLFHKLKSSGLGEYIQIELLENEAIIETDDIIEFIGQLKSIGCRVGMDDLGKGHSNIERLINLPIDYVKIDRSIMENVTHNLEMQNVARGIVRLAHKKGLKVVAEYCSTRELTQLAIELGVDYLQGFYLGKPGPYEFSPDNKQQNQLTSQSAL
jgi:EAL domain-containing protein (putative c-di-GMP-specific phosphodiesterase class I)